MSESHRILVVDDDFATLDFLRSILELSEGDFEVLGVPSAEEGMLALRRANFHLLVADVRLPGMSGLEMARKAREVRPGIPVIMITGYDSPEAETEAAALGVVNYFSKPLDAEDFLNAVFDAVEGIHALGLDPGWGIQQLSEGFVPPEVERRLGALRADTGAQQVVLAAISGEILACTGGLIDEDLQRLVTAIAFSIDSGFHLSDRLGATKPQIIQFLVGESSDLYIANINREHFLAILFDAQVRRGRIGTVWVFTRRAIRDLRSMLAESSEEDEGGQLQPEDSTSHAGSREDRHQEEPDSPELPEYIWPELDVDRPESASEIESDYLTISADESGPAGEMGQEIEENFPEESEPVEISPEGDIQPDNEGEEPSIPGESEPTTDAPALDSLLDDILRERILGNLEGISFEEAIKRGIISPDFNPEDE